jgi:hypothetical protein
VAIIYGRADSEKQLLSKYPNRVKKIEDIDIVYQEMKNELKIKEKGFFAGFKRWNKQRLVNKFEKNKDNPFHAGADGENRVIKKLSNLSDSYHILCGVRIELPYWVTYHGKKNLRSAQMDVVVVSTKGVFLIEVKNWSDDYVKNYWKLNPYEQTGREGLVLWIYLKSIIMNIRVTNILLSIQGNMQYDNNYRAVFVSSLEKINEFLESREEVLSEKEVMKIVGNLKHYVTR